MNKSTYILIAVVVIIILGVWWWSNQPASAPTTGAPAGALSTSDNTASINSNLNSINVQEPDFGPVDTDLNSL